MLKTIAVFFGGESCEHEVSVISGVLAYNAIDKKEYNVIPIFVSKNGKWYTSANLGDISVYKNLKENNLTEVCVLPSSPILYFVRKNKLKQIAKLYSALNCMHGGLGENGGLFAILKQSKIPCSSSGLFSSALSMDKEFTKIALKGIGIDCLPCVKICRENFYLRRDYAIKLVVKKLGFPVIIKPANLGSSIGITTANDEIKLEKSLENGLLFDEKVIVEKRLQSFREINCSAYKKGGKIVVSECEEPILLGEILSFDDKYKLPKEKKFPADIDKKIADKIKQITQEIYRKLNFSGVIRVDFMVDNDRVLVNEINSIPGSLAYYLHCKTTEDFSKMLSDLIEEGVDDFMQTAQSISRFDGGILNINCAKLHK